MKFSRPSFATDGVDPHDMDVSGCILRVWMPAIHAGMTLWLESLFEQARCDLSGRSGVLTIPQHRLTKLNNHRTHVGVGKCRANLLSDYHTEEKS
jgi:hypothetical protein